MAHQLVTATPAPCSTRPRHARHRPDASKWVLLDGGEFNKVLVEVWECGAIGCKWHSDSAPTETPHVDVRDRWDGYSITLTHSRGDTHVVNVEHAHAVWAAACARFRCWGREWAGAAPAATRVPKR